MSNNNYPLDEKALEEQYADLLLKIALKEYLKEQALQMKQQEAEAAPAPQPAQKSSNVVAVAFRQVGWQETKEALLHGLKKGVTRVAVVFLAAALTATTAFALSPVERKESILEKVINTIRNYADMLTNTSTMVEVPRYRYEEYSFIEVPNEQVQEVIDTWVIFRNSVNFTEKSGISLSTVMRAMYYYCEAKGLEYQQNDEVAYCHPIPPPAYENLPPAAFTQLWVSHFQRHPCSLFKREIERKDGENKWQSIIWKQK